MVCVFVRHLLGPGPAEVCLVGNFLMLDLLVLSVDYLQSFVQTLSVALLLLDATCLRVFVLRQKLVSEAIKLLSSLLGLLLAHLIDHLLGLLRPKVRLAVQLRGDLLFRATGTIQFNLLLNVLVVLFQRLLALVLSLAHLMLAVLDLGDELGLLSFSKLF